MRAWNTARWEADAAAMHDAAQRAINDAAQRATNNEKGARTDKEERYNDVISAFKSQAAANLNEWKKFTIEFGQEHNLILIEINSRLPLGSKLVRPEQKPDMTMALQTALDLERAAQLLPP